MENKNTLVVALLEYFFCLIAFVNIFSGLVKKVRIVIGYAITDE